MKITTKPVNMTQFDIRLESGDELYTSCLWARVVLDHDNYTLFSESDCGNYAYGWTPTPNHESFLKLMSRINEGYLLGKIANEDVFLLEVSKDKTIDNIRSSYCHLSDEELERIYQDIRCIDDVGEEGFFREAESILREQGCRDTFEIVHIEKVFPTGAKVFAKLFCTVVQPEIKRQLAVSAAAS